jgi:hypothetical protein
MDAGRQLLRHTLATLAYRGSKTLRGAPDGFAGLKVSESTRTPLAILAHINDLLDWAFHMTQGKQIWSDSTPASWYGEVDRFFDSLRRLDEVLASDHPLGFPPERLFQGPIADALTHVGQIGMLRRIAGSPVRGENYFKADITAGRVGNDQPPPRREFD